jgi:hypothetical protein
MEWLRVPGQEFDGTALTNLPVRYKGYGETWFENQYRGGLRDAVLYQRACSGSLISLEIASGSHGAIFGWDHTVNSSDDDRTIAVLFDRLIREGETVKDAFKHVEREGLHTHGEGDTRTNLEIVSHGVGGEENNAARVREIVTIIDPFIGVPFPDEGAQLDAREIPTAWLLIEGHNGRNMDCMGQTGTFPGLLSIAFTNDPMPTDSFGGGLGEAGCGDFVNVDIYSFSKEEDLVADVRGIICHARRVGEEVVVNPVPVNGSFQMPSAGCGADPGGDLIGSYSDDPCATGGQIGQCDYTDDSVPITFRGLVTHFLPRVTCRQSATFSRAARFSWAFGPPGSQSLPRL